MTSSVTPAENLALKLDEVGDYVELPGGTVTVAIQALNSTAAQRRWELLE